MFPTRTLLQAAAAIKTASPKSTATYIPPFSSTGLTGIASHPFPRPVLIGLYANTLNALSTLPAHSVYRTSTENLTKSRLSIIESVTPPGYDSYLTEITPIKEQYKTHLQTANKSAGSSNVDFDIKLKAAISSAQVRASVKTTMENLIRDEAIEEDMEDMLSYFEDRIHDIERDLGGIPEAIPGNASSASGMPADDGAQAILPNQTEDQANSHSGDNTLAGSGAPEIPPAGTVTATQTSSVEGLPLFPPEPPLTAAQISELEQRLGGGLIEEVINQGFAELKLVEEMRKSKPWEELEEAPVEGQWSYFERNV